MLPLPLPLSPPPPPPQTQWRAHNQQRLLIAYNGLKSKCPEGIYLSLTYGNPTSWSGILFVRKGPYAPAVLRFQVTFPDNYPDRPPLFVFKSDIFHPLVTPLTTYSAGVGTSASGSINSDDHETLPPGGFSLRYAFPRWFQKPQEAVGSELKESANVLETPIRPNPLESGSLEPLSMDPVPRSDPVMDPNQEMRTASLMILKAQDEPLYAVLHYMKDSFENERTLDALPLNAAGNSGAWHAWQAYRRQVKQCLPVGSSSNIVKTARSEDRHTLKSMESSPERRPRISTEWNWDGVWIGRVKKGVDASISESVLYGTSEGDDSIHFLDLNEDTIRAIKNNIIGAS